MQVKEVVRGMRCGRGQDEPNGCQDNKMKNVGHSETSIKQLFTFKNSYMPTHSTYDYCLLIKDSDLENRSINVGLCWVLDYVILFGNEAQHLNNILETQ